MYARAAVITAIAVTVPLRYSRVQARGYLGKKHMSEGKYGVELVLDALNSVAVLNVHGSYDSGVSLLEVRSPTCAGVSSSVLHVTPCIPRVQTARLVPLLSNGILTISERSVEAELDASFDGAVAFSPKGAATVRQMCLVAPRATTHHHHPLYRRVSCSSRHRLSRTCCHLSWRRSASTWARGPES